LPSRLILRFFLLGSVASPLLAVVLAAAFVGFFLLPLLAAAFVGTSRLIKPVPVVAVVALVAVVTALVVPEAPVTLKVALALAVV